MEFRKHDSEVMRSKKPEKRIERAVDVDGNVYFLEVLNEQGVRKQMEQIVISRWKEQIYGQRGEFVVKMVQFVAN